MKKKQLFLYLTFLQTFVTVNGHILSPSPSFKADFHMERRRKKYVQFDNFLQKLFSCPIDLEKAFFLQLNGKN